MRKQKPRRERRIGRHFVIVGLWVDFARGDRRRRPAMPGRWAAAASASTDDVMMIFEGRAGAAAANLQRLACCHAIRRLRSRAKAAIRGHWSGGGRQPRHVAVVVAETASEALAKATAAHPEDKGRFVHYIPRDNVPRCSPSSSIVLTTL
jgi:hypothetical protein